MLTDEEILDFNAELERDGETAVRAKLTKMVYGDGPGHWRWRFVQEFLARTERGLEAPPTKELVDLVHEANRIAKAANWHARKATKWAKWSALGTTVVAIVALVALAKSFGLF